jgi:hypothetical protein
LFRDLATKVAAVESADTEEIAVEETDDLTGETVGIFTNTATGDVVLTTDENEKAALENNPGFEPEDTSLASANESDSDAVKVNRFFNPTSGDHLYTTSEDEANALRDNLSYQEEETNSDLYAYTEQKSGTTPVNRVYNPQTGIHAFTTSQEERDQLIDGGYNDEGVAYYLPTETDTGTTAVGTTPVDENDESDLLSLATNLAERVVAAGVTVDTEAFLNALDTAVAAGGAEVVREIIKKLEGQLANADTAADANSGFDRESAYAVASNKALVDILEIGVTSVLPEETTTENTSLSEALMTLADNPDTAMEELPPETIADLAEWNESWSISKSENIDPLTGEAIYAFTNEKGSVFLTASQAERDSVKNNLSGFDYKGVALVSAKSDDPNAKPVYRVYNSEKDFHGFTLEDISSNLDSEYQDEGVAFYAYNEPQPGTVEIISLFDSNRQIMVYGSSQQIDIVVKAAGFPDREAYYAALGLEPVSSFYALDNPNDNTFVEDDEVADLEDLSILFATNLAERIADAGVTVDTKAFLDTVKAGLAETSSEFIYGILDKLADDLNKAYNTAAADSNFDLEGSYATAFNNAVEEIESNIPPDDGQDPSNTDVSNVPGDQILGAPAIRPGNNIMATSNEDAGTDDNTTLGLGADTAIGGIGSDSIQGSRDADSLDGGVGDDILNGSADNDILNGNAGNDTLNGGRGDDILNGGVGNDILNGGVDNDTLNGGEGDDSLDGGVDNDILNGGVGDDFLDGGRGNDILTGGEGADDFYFQFNANGSFGVDTLTDFNRSEEDKIVLAANPYYSGFQINKPQTQYVGVIRESPLHYICGSR